MSARDVVSHVAPLGLRFWDDATSRVVDEALSVEGRPVAPSATPVRSARSASGVQVFHSIPGLADFQRGGPMPASLVRLRMLVTDPSAAFLPVEFLCDAPQVGFGAALEAALRPITAQAPAPSIPLFSSPAREAVGRAAVRAELRYATSGAPAAWALLEVRHDGALVGRGLSDADGRVHALFAYPPLDPLAAAPTAAAEWPLAVTVRHGDVTGMRGRADLDRVFAFTRRDLREGSAGAFLTELNPRLRPGRVIDLRRVELRP